MFFAGVWDVQSPPVIHINSSHKILIGNRSTACLELGKFPYTVVNSPSRQEDSSRVTVTECFSEKKSGDPLQVGNPKNAQPKNS